MVHWNRHWQFYTLSHPSHSVLQSRTLAVLYPLEQQLSRIGQLVPQSWYHRILIWNSEWNLYSRLNEVTRNLLIPMHVIHLPYLHLFWCTVFPWFIGNLRLLNIFSNVFIRLINLHFSPQILWNPHSILVSCTPILCFDHVYYPIFFLQGVWNPPSIWWLIRYLICHRILSQINWDCLVYIFNIHPFCCLIFPLNQDLSIGGCIIVDIGLI